MQICCFIGHRFIDITEELEHKLKTLMVYFITVKQVKIFLFGSKSEFNDFALKLILELKKQYKFIRIVYVRAEYPNITDEYKSYLLKTYDDTVYPTFLSNAGKAAYIERNKFMIEKSNYCVFFYNENYVPKKKSYRKTMSLKSGTQIAFDYALKCKKVVINLFQES